jgi:hypothetical protein
MNITAIQRRALRLTANGQLGRRYLHPDHDLGRTRGRTEKVGDAQTATVNHLEQLELIELEWKSQTVSDDEGTVEHFAWKLTELGRNVMHQPEPEVEEYLDQNPARPLTRALHRAVRDEPKVTRPEDLSWTWEREAAERHAEAADRRKRLRRLRAA